MVHEDAPHQLRRRAKEMGTAGEPQRSETVQTQVRFVHQRRRLQRVLRPFVQEKTPGDAAKLVIHHRHQLLKRRFVAVPPLLQELGDLALRLLH